MENKEPSLQTNVTAIDFKALAEPAVKLIECVSNAVGVLYEPRRMINQAKAEIEIQKLQIEGKYDLAQIEERAQLRTQMKEVRRQQNIESITGGALKFLPEATIASDSQPEEDWIVDFFEQSQDVSNEKMQILWSKILAGEFTKPNTFSKRTLSFVKTLSEQEAHLFSTFCNYLWKRDGKVQLLFWSDDTKIILEQKGLDFLALKTLEVLGLVNLDLSLSIDNNDELLIVYDEEYSVIPRNVEVALKVFLLTPMGSELATLRDFQPDQEYLQRLTKSLRDHLIFNRKNENLPPNSRRS